jgi:hypothetical protein
MEMFYKIVLFIAVVLLVLILTFMGLLMRSQEKNTVYPPNLNVCPDYWSSNDEGNCTMPTEKSFNDQSNFLNSGGNNYLGASSIAPYSEDTKSFDTKNVLWESGGQSRVCAQKSWANQNNITWDGISNYNKC